MTNLPLRPDGGIDWDRFMPEIIPEVLRLTFVEVARNSSAATLERVIKALPGGNYCDPQEIADMIRAMKP